MTSPMVEAIATIVEAKDAEIDRLKAELEEAREILNGLTSLVTKTDLDEGGVMMELLAPTYTVNAARAFLNRTGS